MQITENLIKLYVTFCQVTNNRKTGPNANIRKTRPNANNRKTVPNLIGWFRPRFSYPSPHFVTAIHFDMAIFFSSQPKHGSMTLVLVGRSGPLRWPLTATRGWARAPRRVPWVLCTLLIPIRHAPFAGTHRTTELPPSYLLHRQRRIRWALLSLSFSAVDPRSGSQSPCT